MSKKLYHIPILKTLEFIEKNKDILNKYIKDKKNLEYHKLLGKGYYYLEIESFMIFFKINRDINYALDTMEYFNSILFFDKIYANLNFLQFDLEKKDINIKDFFYAFFYLLSHKDKELFKSLTQKIFLHYHTTFNPNRNIYIDYKEISHSIIKINNQTIQESFGEDENGSFFKIFIENKLVFNERGKNIKTLRKKVYKKILFLLV